MPEFRVKTANVGFLMFSCGSPVRACSGNLRDDKMLAEGVRGVEPWLLKGQKNGTAGIFSPTGWQVWTRLHERGLSSLQSPAALRPAIETVIGMR